jgi:antitoxin component YwqK of YwqJK toxin-antitoxin module
MSQAIIDYHELVERDGLFFEKSSDVPFTGKISGREQGSFKNGKQVGKWSAYYNDGSLSAEGSFKNGKKEGEWVYYWSNGKLQEEGSYKNGKKEGKWGDYDSDGTLISDYSGTYKNGKKVSD